VSEDSADIRELRLKTGIVSLLKFLTIFFPSPFKDPHLNLSTLRRQSKHGRTTNLEIRPTFNDVNEEKTTEIYSFKWDTHIHINVDHML
jgi:hypothetical protein